MNRPRPLLLLLVLCFALPLSAPRAQDEDADALAREAVEGATTVEERRRVLAALLAAAARRREAGDGPGAARALNAAGGLQMRLNLAQDALATYQQALALLRRAPDPPTRVDSLNGLAEVYNRSSKCDEARPYLQQALALSEQNGYAAGKAAALITLSGCQNYTDHALALRTAQEALALWQTTGRKREIAQAYSTIGDYHLAQSNLAEAAQSQEAALQLWRELGVADEQAEALINLGYVEYRRGGWQNCISFFTQARGLLDEKAEPYKMGQVTTGLADTFIESGSPETGLELYRQALEYYRQTQDQRAVIVMLWEIGKAYYIQGDYAAALENLQSARAGAVSIKEPTVTAMCDELLGRTLAARGERDDALRHFQSALDSYTRASNPMEVGRVRALMGQVYQQQGKVERAREYYRSALEAFRALSDHVNESATLYALGTLELGQNDLGAAEDDLRQSIEATEDIRRVSTSRDLTAAFSASVQERYEAYVECLMRERAREPSRSLDAVAFETSELARARSLAEMLRATGASLAQGLDPALAEREKSLRQSLRAKEDAKVALLGRAYKQEELEALDAELARLGSEYEQVNADIRARHPAYGEVTRPAAWDLRRIQEQVVADDQTVLLEYSLGVERSYVWAVTRDGFASYELPPRAQVNGAAERVYKLLSAEPGAQTDAELKRATEELSRMVLAPVAAELNRRRVVVVADGSLNYIPFQVLPAPQTGEPLVAGCEVVGAPSATILGELRRETASRRPAPQLVAAFGDPVFASNYAQRKEPGGGAMLGLQSAGVARGQRDIEVPGDDVDPSLAEPLFYAAGELEHLRDVADADASVATSFDATRERLLGTDLTRYAILHFATHGFLDPRRPERSSLLLSTVDRDGRPLNGLVSLQDIYGLRAPVDLVVLSACRTALGQEVRGEGLIGLTRGFMYAGASSVVASLWKVNDEATSELMRLFYTNMLRRGMTPAAALRDAQNSIRQQPQWRSPYYWAAFTLQGEYRQPVRRSPAVAPPVYAKWIVAAVVLALLLPLAGAAFWYLRRRSRLA
jgi:CHAT domain-containing protein/Tfp pilus assembly protein PilF